MLTHINGIASKFTQNQSVEICCFRGTYYTQGTLFLFIIRLSDLLMSIATNTYLTMGTVLVDDAMDARILGMWSKREVNEGFYKTGFETILFNRPGSFALETVLSSVMTWDKELLIAGPCATLDLLDKRTAGYGFHVHLCAISHDSWNAIDEMLILNPGITHLLLNISSSSIINSQEIFRLLNLIENYRLTLIVNCQSEVDGINDQFLNAIDFMVAEHESDEPGSFVVARRSKLVQTEGNARNFTFDLYTYWQHSLRNRNAIIEPMCG